MAEGKWLSLTLRSIVPPLSLSIIPTRDFTGQTITTSCLPTWMAPKDGKVTPHCVLRFNNDPHLTFFRLYWRRYIFFTEYNMFYFSVLWSHPRSDGTNFVWGLCVLDGWEVQITETCSQDHWRPRDWAPQLLAGHQINQGLPLPPPTWRYDVCQALVIVLSS